MTCLTVVALFGLCLPKRCHSGYVRTTRLGPLVAIGLGAFALMALLVVMSLGSPSTSVAASQVKLTRIGTFDGPVAVVQPPGDRQRLLVVEHTGSVRVLVGGHRLAKPFLNISSLVSCCGERGLLGLAFAPDYATSRRFYVDYTNSAGDTRVVEYRRSARSANTADPTTARTVLAQEQPQANHNGGNLAFGPDGKLYIGFGDGGAGDDPHGLLGNGQNLNTLLGKILRINPLQSGAQAYTVPADNPFVGRSDTRPEIWSYGLRNPWRFSFDRKTGGLAIGDVGQDNIEEIDWSAAPTRGRGLNFGWRPWEGTRANFPSESAAGAVFPVAQYAHGSGLCSVTGGYVIRDPRLKALQGRYIYADFCSNSLFTLGLKEGRLAAHSYGPLRSGVRLVSSFGEDLSGRIYVTQLDGAVYRIDPSA